MQWPLYRLVRIIEKIAAKALHSNSTRASRPRSQASNRRIDARQAYGVQFKPVNTRNHTMNGSSVHDRFDNAPPIERRVIARSHSAP